MGSIGITTFPTDYSIDIAVLAAKAEETGFDSLWVAEHPVLPVGAKTPWPGPGELSQRNTRMLQILS